MNYIRTDSTKLAGPIYSSRTDSNHQAVQGPILELYPEIPEPNTGLLIGAINVNTVVAKCKAS